MKRLKIIKNRSDIGAGTRGSDLGIDALEIAAINAGNDFFHRYPYMDIPTHNETIYDKVNNSFAKRINFVAEQCERLAEAVNMVVHQGYFPLILSGDHSSAAGSIAGLKKAYPDLRLGVIWIDAHADLHSPYTTPSGNVHGMPLAAALGFDYADKAVRTLDASTHEGWQSVVQMAGKVPAVAPEDLIYFGLRSTEVHENSVIDDHGIRFYRVAETRHRGLLTCLDEALDQFQDVDHVYITFDVDSLDCDLVSRGTGTPVEKGFDPQEVQTIIAHFMQHKKVAALEVCEINPLLDEKGNRMAETAFGILQSLFSSTD